MENNYRFCNPRENTNKSEFSQNQQETSGNIATVLLHDYFHHGVFQTVLGEKQWDRLDSRLDMNTDQVCALLQKHNVKATFFALGWIGDKYPEIIRKIVLEGHEIASAGYNARSVRQMTPEQFRKDLNRSKVALENAGANKIIGYRSAYQWFRESELWALDILIEEGYLYDASYRPALVNIFERSHRRFIHQYRSDKGEIWEFPSSTITLMGFNLPISGGAYFRHFPHIFMFNNFIKWQEKSTMPFVLYFLPWELDRNQPVVSALGPLSRIRRYRNAGKLAWILPKYFNRGLFQSIHQYLNISLDYEEHKNVNERGSSDLEKENIATEGMKVDSGVNQIESVTVVIPCYNESPSIQYLSKAIEELIREAKVSYNLKLIFVDDCSDDGTYTKLHETFGNKENCKIIRHGCNLGVAASIRTGIEAAETELVCSIDADCSYDPLTLLQMIPRLTPDVDVVTASPYHRDGFVLGVPGWRLFLSKSLSRIYHLMLRQKLSTYTSCFRVYRRSSILNLRYKYGDFRGILELIAMADIAGLTIVEHPTTLQCRIYGHSKMKIFKTILGHLKVICEVRDHNRKRSIGPHAEDFR